MGVNGNIHFRYLANILFIARQVQKESEQKMNRDQFKIIMPLSDAVKWFEPLCTAMRTGHINTPQRESMFIAQLAHESNQLRTVEENLNYSAKGLASTWPKRYANADGTPNSLAICLSNKPRLIANNAYADRMGNGPESSGDGWKYRGLGPIQLTGKDNHFDVAKFFHIDVERIGEWLLTPDGGCQSAVYLWVKNACYKYADKGDFDGCCDAINLGRKTEKIGDSIGYDDRKKFYLIAKKAYGV